KSVKVAWRDESRKGLREFRSGPLAQSVTTDKDGRFLIEGLVPGQQFVLQAIFDQKKRTGQVSDNFEVGPIKSGDTRNLGDLKLPQSK
ncbi:MAG TPA: hypothetical protein VG122_18195, partial [Gemmata sp.]|nr:hypothetical protein [Gemmata sp.]